MLLLLLLLLLPPDAAKESTAGAASPCSRRDDRRAVVQSSSLSLRSLRLLKSGASQGSSKRPRASRAVPSRPSLAATFLLLRAVFFSVRQEYCVWCAWFSASGFVLRFCLTLTDSGGRPRRELRRAGMFLKDRLVDDGRPAADPILRQIASADGPRGGLRESHHASNKHK